MKRCRLYLPLLLCAVGLLLCSCDATRYLGEGETILRKVKVESASKAVNPSEYRQFVRQEANARWFSLIKVPLGLYCLSPADTTRSKGRFWRRIGEAPVVYDTLLTEASRLSLKSAMISKGFLHAQAYADTVVRRRRVDVTYRLYPGDRYYVRRYHYVFDSPVMEKEVADLASATLLRDGQPLDLSTLSDERSRIVSGLQDKGYYRLNKEFVRYSVDTLSGSQAADVTLLFRMPPGVDTTMVYRKYRYGRITIEEHQGDTSQVALVLDAPREEHVPSTEQVGAHYAIRPKVYLNNITLRPDSVFSETFFAQTHSALGSLPTVSSASVRLRPAEGDTARLDALVSVHLAKRHGISAELEGTNTSGDLGAAVSLTYQNRNLFRGAESFSVKLRGAYEAITGLEDYNDQNYFEYGIETSLRFPSSHLPFAPKKSRPFTRSTSEMRLLFDSQNRPEFHRRSLSAAWAYRWTDFRHTDQRHYLDLLGITYVFMPWISDTFRKQYLEGQDRRYSILRSSYEDLFIMNSSYTFVLNKGETSPWALMRKASADARGSMWQLKVGGEIAGNLLYAFSALTHAPKNDAGQYKLFGIAFSQYAKVEVDYSYLHRFDKRNSFAMHFFFGLALPYGNASTIPYEKRYFSGGANSVRGWGVRELGPGAYAGKDGNVDFINQTGNLKLDCSFEWRTNLFWKFSGAIFVDAGNVWNTRNYVGQEAGTFRFSSFWKQFAVSYGIGLRLQFDYFTLRLNGGMKAVNPVYENSRQHFPIFHPIFSRDFALHFAVGLPF